MSPDIFHLLVYQHLKQSHLFVDGCCPTPTRIMDVERPFPPHLSLLRLGLPPTAVAGVPAAPRPARQSPTRRRHGRFPFPHSAIVSFSSRGGERPFPMSAMLIPATATAVPTSAMLIPATVMVIPATAMVIPATAMLIPATATVIPVGMRAARLGMSTVRLGTRAFSTKIGRA